MAREGRGQAVPADRTGGTESLGEEFAFMAILFSLVDFGREKQRALATSTCGGV
jgi:hypothetical protein